MGLFNVISMLVIVVVGIATGTYFTLKSSDQEYGKLVRTGEARYSLKNQKW